MKPTNDVPIPSCMRHLARDRRGYPIPVVVLVDRNGEPHFTMNDEDARWRCIERDLCTICGGKLFRGRWFVGGPLSAFDPDGAYVDPPLHGECARYALRVCPYLAAPNYSKRIDARTLRPGAEPGLMLMVDATMIPDRPAVFVSAMAAGQTVTGDRTSLQSYVKPKRPYLRIEYWREGVQLAAADAWAILGDDLLKARGVRELLEPRVGWR